MDDGDFKINLAFDECCSVLNDTDLSLSLCFSIPERSIETFDLLSFYRRNDPGGDRVENYERIVRFIEGVEMIGGEKKYEEEIKEFGNFFYVLLEKF